MRFWMDIETLIVIVGIDFIISFMLGVVVGLKERKKIYEKRN